MKLTITICDDDPLQAENFKNLTRKWAQKRGADVSVAAYPSADALLFNLPEHQADILLLDIQMPGTDGMTLARELRASGGRQQIIFVTGFADWLAEGYEVDAVHYLLKPVGEVRLFAALDKAVARIAAEPRRITFNADGETFRLAADEIIYAEAFSHYIELHTISRTIKLKMTLNALAEILGADFLRCHRSYIVGMKFVNGITRAEILLDSGSTLPLSRKVYNAANEAFIKYNRGF
jgi:DNA-binding LytR/AlgR family response regulator